MAGDDLVERLEAVRELLAAQDERQAKMHDLLEVIREQIRLGVASEHRPEGLFKNIQDAVYAMRGRVPLLNDAAITAPLAQAAYVLRMAKIDALMFPIMGGPALPWSLIAPYEAQAHKNHGQTLKRLAERGGLSMAEAMAVMSSATWRDRPIAKPTVEEWLDFVAKCKARAFARRSQA